ncbi:dihydrofolate reductase [bacterium]|nr:dihydrofolate reductase [bacterium]
MKIKIIAAVCKNNGIGKNNCLPWNSKTDLKFFSKTTKGNNNNNAVLMGRKTWESLKNPLINRFNIIISSQNLDNSLPNVKVFKNIDEALQFSRSKNFDILWVIGGSQIYQTFLNNYCNQIDACIITHIEEEYDCDSFFPNLNKWKVSDNIIIGNYEHIVNIYVKY